MGLLSTLRARRDGLDCSARRWAAPGGAAGAPDTSVAYRPGVVAL
ncbi:hypothetical protein [Gordonia rhizosphera]|nr:hypothetical protein [Gordonia rhizosphera]